MITSPGTWHHLTREEVVKERESESGEEEKERDEWIRSGLVADRTQTAGRKGVPLNER